MRFKKEEVLQIPTLLEEGKTQKEISNIFNCHERTINYWVHRLRSSGYQLLVKRGAPRMKLC